MNERRKYSIQLKGIGCGSRPIVLGNNTVECVTTYKLLGIIISNDLKWNEHIDYISKKASKRLYSLRILKKVGVSREGILKVYLTTIRPFLEYGVQVWQDIPEFLSNKLESIQKRALRIIYPCHSYLDALNITNLSSLKERRTQLCRKYIQRMSQNDHPINFLKPRTATSSHSYNLRPAATIEIMFTLIGVVAGPSVQVPLFHSLVNM